MADSYFNSGTVTLPAAGALVANTLVYNNAGSATNTSASSTYHTGVVMKDVANANDSVAILLPASGIQQVKSSGTIAVNAALTYAASGCVATAGNGDLVIGRAITAATTSGDLISAVLYQNGVLDPEGTGLDTLTVTFSGVAATDVLTLTIFGETPVDLTAIAYGATPSAGQFAIGTGGTLNTAAATNCAAAINALAATTLPGVEATASSATVTITCTSFISGAASAGDQLKVVVANHTTADKGGSLTDRITQAQVDLDTAETALDYVEADILSLAAKSHNGVTITLSSAVADNAVTVNGQAYTFKAAPASAVQVTLGATDTASATNLAAVLNALDGYIATSSSGVVTLYYPAALTVTENTSASTIVVAAITNTSSITTLRTDITTAQTAIDVVEADILSSAASTHEGITITLSTVVADNAVTINGVTRTFKASPSGITQVALGASDTEAATNLATNINNIDGWIATSSAGVVTAYYPTAITATENTGATKIVIAAVTNDHSNAYLDTRVTALETGISLSLPAAAGNIAAKTLVTPTLDTVLKFAYASHTTTANLWGVSPAGATAGASCTAIKWGSASSHVVASTAAAVAVGDIMVIDNGTGKVVTTSGASQVAIGKSNTAVGGGGGDITIIPCVPYLTA